MSGSGSHDGGSRRRRHRSRSRHHRHRREHRSGHTQVKVEEGVPAPVADSGRPPQAYGYPPPPWSPGGPPAGWHGISGGGPPSGPMGHPGYIMHPSAPSGPLPFGHHMGPPPPFGGPPGGPSQGTPVPYSSPFGNAVPPPSSLDDDYRKGKGKGKGKDHFGGFGEHEGELRPTMPDGLLVSNVPADVNTLDLLNKHFRKFGEVLKITVQATEGRAFVQFAEQAAVQAAAASPIFDRPDITLSMAPRGDKGKGKKVKGKDRPTHLDKPAEHRTLCSNPEEQLRLDAAKRKRDEIFSRRSALLSGYTDQLKTIMSKLNAPDVPEARRESLRLMILQVKEKMDALSTEHAGTEEGGKGKSAKRQKGDGGGDGKGVGDAKGASSGGKGAGADGKRSSGLWTLDLRPKVLRANLPQGWTQERLREELTKLGAADDKVLCVHMEGFRGGEVKEGMESALLQFKDRRVAEQIFNRRADLPFEAEWCNDVPPASATVAAAATTAPTGSATGEGDPIKAEELSLLAAAAEAAAAPDSAAPAVAATEGAVATTEAAEPTAEGAAEKIEGATAAAVAEGAEASPAVPEPAAPEPQHRVDLSEEEDEVAGN